MTVQLIGAITGTTDYEKCFEIAKSNLKKLGYDVVNPVPIGEKVTKKYNGMARHEDYMRATISSLCDVDAVCIIDEGKSEGEIAEIEVAKAIGLTFIDYKMVTRTW